eukprot:scaffold267387_cov15-Prasinocladus_malaysianus.AAC.1
MLNVIHVPQMGSNMIRRKWKAMDLGRNKYHEWPCLPGTSLTSCLPRNSHRLTLTQSGHKVIVCYLC